MVRINRKRASSAVMTGLMCLVLFSHNAAAQIPGMMLEDAGIHFLTPFGFELTKVEVLNDTGPAQMILLEPQDGSYQGEMNSGFIAFTVYSSEVSTTRAVQTVVDQLSQTFSGSGGLRATPETISVGGEPRDGYRLDFQLVELPLVGFVSAFSQGELTVVAYYQGRPAELEALAEIIEAVLGAVGVGPVPPAE